MRHNPLRWCPIKVQLLGTQAVALPIQHCASDIAHPTLLPLADMTEPGAMAICYTQPIPFPTHFSDFLSQLRRSLHNVGRSGGLGNVPRMQAGSCAVNRLSEHPHIRCCRESDDILHMWSRYFIVFLLNPRIGTASAVVRCCGMCGLGGVHVDLVPSWPHIHHISPPFRRLCFQFAGCQTLP